MKSQNYPKKKILLWKYNENVTNHVTNNVTDNKITTETLVLKLLKDNPIQTRDELAKAIGKNIRTIQRALAKLSNEGKIKRIGSTRTGYWEVLF